MKAKLSAISCRLPFVVLSVLTLFACGPTGGNESSQRAKLDEAAIRIYAEVPVEADRAKLAEQGRKFFRQAGCESCHSTREDRMGLMGPPLGGLPARVLKRYDDNELESRRWLIKHIKNPHLYPSPYAEDEQYQGMQMPAYNQFRDEDMRALVEFLWTLR